VLVALPFTTRDRASTRPRSSSVFPPGGTTDAMGRKLADKLRGPYAAR
jgi:hypothetical protein